MQLLKTGSVFIIVLVLNRYKLRAYGSLNRLYRIGRIVSKPFPLPLWWFMVF